MEEIKRTSMALFDEESNYKEIAEIVDESIMAVYAEYGADKKRDIRGSISVNVKEGEMFQHLSTYSIHGCKMSHFSTVDIYYPNALIVCDVQITVSVCNNNEPEMDEIAEEVSGRIAKAVVERMPESYLNENANCCTLEKVFRKETLAFDTEWAYKKAEAYGIKDHGLVDKVLGNLLQEKVLEPMKDHENVYRLTASALEAAIAV